MQEQKQVQNNIQKGQIPHPSPSKNNPIHIISIQKANNFLTNQKSPFRSSPPPIQQIFSSCKQQDETLNLQKLDIHVLPFEVKLTRNNFCSHFVVLGSQTYVQCKQCTADGCTSMCFCQACFQQDKHIGHTTVRVKKQKGWAYCDCGRYERIKKQYFCQKHSKFDEQIKIQISQEQKQLFLSYFTWIFECCVYLDMNSYILNKLNGYLMKLNESSVYYNRLTFQLLTTQSKYITEEQKAYLLGTSHFYFVLCAKCNNKWRLTLHMCGDLKSRKNFIKFLCKLVDQGLAQNIKQNFSATDLQQLFNFTAIQKLEEQDNFTHKLLNDVFSSNQSSQEIKTAFHRYTNNRLAKCKKLQQIFNLSSEILSDKVAWQFLLKYFDLFWNQKQLTQYAQNSFLQSKKHKANNLTINNKTISGQNLPNQIRVTSKMIHALSAAISQYKIEKIKNLRSIILSRFNNQSRFDQFLRWMILCTGYQFRYFEEKKINRFDMITLLALIKGSPRQQQFIDLIWNQLLRCHQLFTEKQTQRGRQVMPFSQIHLIIDIFNYVMVTLIRADFYALIKIKNKSKDEEQLIGTWFKQFLYQRKAVTLQQIVILKSQGTLDFKDASKILNEYCQYNQDQQIFVYNSSRSFKNLANKFPLFPSKGNYPSIYNNQIYFGVTDDTKQNSLSKIFIPMILKGKNIISSIDHQWQRYPKSAQFRDGKYNYGYLYLFSLVTYDVLTHGQDKDVRERLQILATDAQQCIQFAATQNQATLLARLLGYIQKNIEQKQQQKRKIQSIVIDKNKTIQKKKKIAEKFNKKRQLVLKKIQSQAQHSTDQQICILCHEKQKANNPFVYISQINKDNTICSSIHGVNNISNTFLMTCFHFVHVNCYIGIQKNINFGFNCPLCQTQSNCILPINYDPSNQRLNRICNNAMIATIMASYRVYDVQSPFILIFKHLVESKGLNSLLQITRYQQKKKIWAKNDQYLQALMRDIYDHSDDEIKQEFQKSINKFIEEIKNCKNRELKIIQLTFAEIFKNIVVTGHSQVDKQVMLEIRSLIQEDEFIIVKQQIQALLLNQIQLQPETQQERKRLKASMSFHIIRLPEKSNDCLKKYYPKICEACAKFQSLHVCLLCGNLLCNQCKPKHSVGFHNQNTIYFNLGNFRIDCNRKNYSLNGHIYYNEFKVPLEVGVKFEAMVRDQYTINEIKFQKIMNNFFEN